jgi:hypothetical protein
MFVSAPKALLGRGGTAYTDVVAVAVLFAVLISGSIAATLTVLLTPPTTVGVTTIDTIGLEPMPIVPRLQVTVNVPAQEPWLGVAETNVSDPGRESLKSTPVALAVPLLVTVIV